MKWAGAGLLLCLAGPGLADKLPVFDDHAAYTVRSFEEGRVWVEQGAMTYLCALAPAQLPAAVILRHCQPLITPERHQTFAVAHAAADKVRQVVSAAETAQAAPLRGDLDEKIADLEAFSRAVSQLDASALADRMLSFSRDLASLTGHACVIEPAEMHPANAINAGQLLFLEFGVVTDANEAVTVPMGMELEVRNYLDQLRYIAGTTTGHQVSVERIAALQETLRLVRQRLRDAQERLLRERRQIYEGRAIRIVGCA